MIGQAGAETNYSFEIPKAWYETSAAKLSLLLALGFVLTGSAYTLRKSVKKKIQKEKDIALDSKRLLELEIEQLKLRQQQHQIEEQKNKLEEDLVSQQKELANYTMLLVRKKEIMMSIYEELKSFRKSLKLSGNRKRISSMLSAIKQHQVGEKYMEVFDVNFERVHRDFFKRLKQLNPEISRRELRLCAFVKMDLTNKEIAPLLNISVRGVETARYRIRKKLNIREVNFKSFLDSLAADVAHEA
jgi:hypothetical protein